MNVHVINKAHFEFFLTTVGEGEVVKQAPGWGEDGQFKQ